MFYIFSTIGSQTLWLLSSFLYHLYYMLFRITLFMLQWRIWNQQLFRYVLPTEVNFDLCLYELRPVCLSLGPYMHYLAILFCLFCKKFVISSDVMQVCSEVIYFSTMIISVWVHPWLPNWKFDVDNYCLKIVCTAKESKQAF